MIFFNPKAQDLSLPTFWFSIYEYGTCKREINMFFSS